MKQDEGYRQVNIVLYNDSITTDTLNTEFARAKWTEIVILHEILNKDTNSKQRLLYASTN